MSFLGDGVTISGCPLLNITDSVKNIPVAVLETVDCKVHLSDGNKNGTFVCNQFLNHMKEIDPAKNVSDIVMFDGDLNLQLVVRLL